ncbi:MAG: hypothetical protein OXT67_09690, partial [Zetaproteobacteria bacterium]|nr:hypothetical protein [Zetaproteobacteria bacterium]
MKALKGFWVILSLVSILVSFARAASLSERVAPEPEPSLHVLLLDACLLPEDLDFFRGKHLRVEFITSAKPALKRVFNSEICMSHYRRAVGDAGAVVEFHSNFLGTKMASHQEVIRVVDRIVKKRGPLDFVVANNSDQAAYIASFVRAHLGQQTPWQNVPKPENFYDKYQMKTNLRKNAPDIRTADFVALDASEIELNQFLQRADFPQQPIILKKRRSAGSVGILVMHSMKDYIAMKKKVKDKHNYLIEKFIRGRVFRVAGERIDHKLKFVIPSINFTSPYEHYKLAKPRATTSIDDTIVAGKDFYQFTDKVLDALEMVSGTFHLEGILSDQDDELYFMEIALRVGEGNMDAPHREVFGYHAKRAYFFKQFPQGYFSEEDEQHYV